MIDKEVRLKPVHIDWPSSIIQIPTSPIREFAEKISTQAAQWQALVQPMIAQASVLHDLASIVQPIQATALQSINQITTVYSELAKLIPPSIEWFQGFDFSSINTLPSSSIGSTCI